MPDSAARLVRAGELTPVQVTSPAEEAVRDLVHARDAMLAHRKRAQQRLTAVPMRHGRVWRARHTGRRRTGRGSPRSGSASPALASAIGYYQATLAVRKAEMASLEAELIPWAAREPLAGPTAGQRLLPGHRRAARALTLAAELVDWLRFPAARAFMATPGWCPPEGLLRERTRRAARWKCTGSVSCWQPALWHGDTTVNVLALSARRAG